MPNIVSQKTDYWLMLRVCSLWFKTSDAVFANYVVAGWANASVVSCTSLEDVTAFAALFSSHYTFHRIFHLLEHSSLILSFSWVCLIRPAQFMTTWTYAEPICLLSVSSFNFFVWRWLARFEWITTGCSFLQGSVFSLKSLHKFLKLLVFVFKSSHTTL